MKNNYYKSNIQPKNKPKKVNKVSFILTIVFIVFWTLTGFLSLFNLFYNLSKNNNTAYTNVKAVANDTDSIYINYEIFTNNTEYSFEVPLSVASANYIKFSTTQSEDNHLIGIRPFQPLIQDGSTITTYIYFIEQGTFISFNVQPSSELFRYDNYNYSATETYSKSYNSLYNFSFINNASYDYYYTEGNYFFYMKRDVYIYVRTIVNTNTNYFSYVTWQQDYIVNQYATTILSDSTFSQTYQNGYNNGYYAGVAYDSTHDYDYTFLGLIGSIVDAPLNAINDMLNFNFLGINMSAFLQGLLTISLIIAVVRLII